MSIFKKERNMLKDLRALVKFNINHSINQPKYVIIIDIALYINKTLTSALFLHQYFKQLTWIQFAFLMINMKEFLIKTNFYSEANIFCYWDKLTCLYTDLLLKRSNQGIKWIRTQTHSYPNGLIVPKTLWSSKHLITVILQFTSL